MATKIIKIPKGKKAYIWIYNERFIRGYDGTMKGGFYFLSPSLVVDNEENHQSKIKIVIK